MTYTRASPADVESKMDDEQGGLWFLKDALDTERLGFSVLELEPGASGTEHDHADGEQEEVYYVVSGTVEVELDGERETLGENEAIRLSPDQTRQLHNAGDGRAKLVLAGAPR